MGIAVTQDGKKVYVTNSETSDVSVLDTATNTVITTVPVGRTPTHIARGNDPQPTLII
jgi:YVTN family beta-propeller protein